MTVRTVDNPQYELACDRCGAVFTSPRGRTAYSPVSYTHLTLPTICSV